MNTAVTILIDGLTYASWLFIVALGLTLVFGVLKILNIAHGSFYALGAYAAASFVAWFATLKLRARLLAAWRMLLAAVAVAALLAPLTERGLLRFFYGRDEVLLVLVTYAMFLILEDATKLIWGANPYFVSRALQPVRQRRRSARRPTSATTSCWWRSPSSCGVGRVVGPEPHAPRQDRAGGDPQRRGRRRAWASTSRASTCWRSSFGIFLAALGGAFTAPMISVQPGVSVGVIIVSFAVVIIGGLGSIEGAAIGALIVGLARSLAVHTCAGRPSCSRSTSSMAVVLMFRPEGLFQRIQARKI